MFKYRIKLCVGAVGICLAFASCTVPAIVQSTEKKSVPGSYETSRDSTNMSATQWRKFFTDQNLVNLIDTALTRNQELQITLQEIEIAKNEVLFRQGPLSPRVGARLGIGVDKVGEYTSQGAGDKSTEITPGQEVPNPLFDITAAVYASWEVDIWKKLRNAKKAAITRYLSTLEGRNFVLTNLVAEVATSYYELLALDNQLEFVRQNIRL